MNAPLDRTHADCLNAREWLRRWFLYLRIQAAQWEPRPMPEHWGRR